MGQGVDPVDITKAGLERAREGGFDTVIVDTAGRQVVDDTLMNELKNIQVSPLAFLPGTVFFFFFFLGWVFTVGFTFGFRFWMLPSLTRLVDGLLTTPS